MMRGSEFAQGWPVLLAAAIGGSVGISGLMAYNLGLFYVDLSREIGLTRTQLGMAYFAATAGIAVSMPAVGALLDRCGVNVTIAAGAALMALTFACIAVVPLTVPVFVFLMFMSGALGGPSTSVGYTRAVNSWFVHRRGLALGISQAAVGLSGFIVPLATAHAIATYGWPAGFLLLAFCATLGVPIALIWIRTCPRNEQPSADRRSGGPGIREVRRQMLFWQLMLATTSMGLAFGGLLPHFVPMLRLEGVPPMQAAAHASLIGMAVTLSRLIVGWLVDLIHAPWIGAVTCGLCALACLALALDQIWIAPFAAIALGAVLGAEVDLIGYLTAKYFGLETYSRAYAWQYGGFALAAGVSPIWVGYLADRMGGYSFSLAISVALLLGSIILLLRLPRYSLGSGTDNVDMATDAARPS